MNNMFCPAMVAFLLLLLSIFISIIMLIYVLYDQKGHANTVFYGKVTLHGTGTGNRIGTGNGIIGF